MLNDTRTNQVHTSVVNVKIFCLDSPSKTNAKIVLYLFKHTSGMRRLRSRYDPFFDVS